MANRHAHKKLRADIRLRMARTGESYQKARSRILKQSLEARRKVAAELVPIHYFGLPATLAVVEQAGHVLHLVLPSATIVERD